MSDFRSQGAPLPTDPDLLMSHGQQILKQGDQEAAAAAFERLLRIRPDWALAREFLVEALNQHSLALAGHERLEEALRVSQRALEADPNHIDALNIRGYVLMDLSRFSEAATCYEKAVAAEPSIAELWCSLGTALSRDRRLSEAETAYGRAIALSPRFALAVINRAHALVSLGRYADAVSAFEEALRLKPGDPHLKAALLTNRAHVCDWRDRNLLLADTAACFTRSDLTAQGIVLDAFASQILYDDPGLQRSAAEIFAARLYGPPHAWTGDRRASRDRIRIGYFSPDFGDHPIAHLMAGLFERHDRSRFEVCAFSLGPRSHNPWRTRIADGVEHFIDLADASGSEIMTAALQYELDIAVDLAGYTHGNHAELFARRIAPVQVGYLGYLGTLGAPFLDYLLADETIVPPDHQRF
ncbi:MAG TPA: tetratricopeptide repeat protein, partial [Asticcacaulis sp.]|nr:tetratricopeptide repeat protein [Asticcacaulis sp.]